MPQAASAIVAPTEIALTVGETEALAIIVLDSNGGPIPDAVLTFTSSDGAVATVDPAGVIMAVAEGSAVVTVETASLAAHVGVTVQAVTVGSAVGSIVIHPPEFGMTVGETVQLSVTVLDENGREIPDAAVTYSSDKEGVATVDTDGLVKAVGPDNVCCGVTITATSGGISATAIAGVGADHLFPRVRIEPIEATIPVGDRLQLSARVLNESGEEIPICALRTQCPSGTVGVSWSSVADIVATVNHTGVVTGVAGGRTTIYADIADESRGYLGHMAAAWAVITVE
jgi:uncharacterized protein YjdB